MKTKEQMILLLKRKTPAENQLMTATLKIAPMRIEAWAEGRGRLDDDEVDILEAWLSGEYAMFSGKEGFQRVHKANGGPVGKLPRSPEYVVTSREVYIPGEVPTNLVLKTPGNNNVLDGKQLKPPPRPEKEPLWNAIKAALPLGAVVAGRRA